MIAFLSSIWLRGAIHFVCLGSWSAMGTATWSVVSYGSGLSFWLPSASSLVFSGLLGYQSHPCMSSLGVVLHWLPAGLRQCSSSASKRSFHVIGGVSCPACCVCWSALCSGCNVIWFYQGLSLGFTLCIVWGLCGMTCCAVCGLHSRQVAMAH